MPDPKIVFFDLDNTLYDYESAHSAAQSSLIDFFVKQLGIDAAHVNSGLDRARNEIKLRLGAVASGHSRLLYITQFLTNRNVTIRPSLAIAAEQSYWRTFLLNIEVFDGVKDLLTALRLRNCRIILVTDLNISIQYRKLTWMGLEAFFDLIVTSEEAGGDKVTGKPEGLLRSILNEMPASGWCVGDQAWDHLFKESTSFYCRRQGSSGNSISRATYFNEFAELIALLD